MVGMLEEEKVVLEEGGGGETGVAEISPLREEVTL